MTYPAVFLFLLPLCFLGGVALTGGLYALALQNKLPRLPLLPPPRDRDIHTERKPRIGGIAIWLVVLLTLVILPQTPAGNLLDFGHPGALGIDRSIWGVLCGLMVILGFGLLDDLYSLKWGWQLLGQILAAFALILAGIGPTFINLPLLGTVNLSPLASALFTLIWTLTLINVMNFFDGLDGLAGSMAITSALVMMVISLNLGSLGTATLALILLGAVAGYLPWNWHPSKIFMGTVGSETLGFMLAVVAIISGAKVATAVLVLGIPVLDAVLVVVRRLRAGVSPFKADQRHLHHRLLRLGLSVPKWSYSLT